MKFGLTNIPSMTTGIEEQIELIRDIKDFKRERDDNFLHYERHTNVKEMYDDKENSQSNCVSKRDYFGKNFKPERKYPTIRSHYDQLVGSAPNFMPSHLQQTC
jgi:hypothetical protein